MNPREQFAATTTALLDERADTALVYAEVSGQYFGDATKAHPDRVINVGIREQLLVSAAAGLALTGMRPIAHTFGPFLVERAFEQIKLDFGHQGVGGVLVGSAGSFDVAVGGRTHQAPGDVTLLDTLPGVTVHAPSTDAEVDAALREAVAGDGLHYVRVTGQTNRETFPVGPRLHEVKRGERAVVVALGPVLDDVLAATADLDVTVLYTSRVRPFDGATLRAALSSTDVVVVEPWLAGTSAHVIAEALADRPHRLLALGVSRDEELRRYGSPSDHVRAHGLDAAGIRRRLDAWLG
ncbi:transketolase family protein [Saccharomonospora sp. NB11]|jgi:transketolase|uniref:transketolase family protein n=1 Tax=Saccharomonospora sp. NB11 TaxID=1642298 RepID=UPI0018D0D700|nr:transketolase [Saccharomonospora sp. NB11]